MSFYSEHLFPPLLDWATRPFYRDRQRLIAQARGRVLELGAGSGANLPLYGPEAHEIHALEPDLTLLERARQQAARSDNPQRFRLVRGDAQRLPYPDNHFDTIVACLVLCTIPDPGAAAREMHRVLAGDGQVLVLEHQLAEAAATQRWQRRLDPLWQRLACGCHLDRPTSETLRAAGFDLSGTRRFRHPKVPGLFRDLLEGSARPIAATAHSGAIHD